jgi:tetratricopeptide (TPR) repeat protein
MKTLYKYERYLAFSTLLVVLALSQTHYTTSSFADTSALHQDSYGDKLGTVQFLISCKEEAKPQMERGLALLHHMTYDGARAAFESAGRQDPECAMSYWGQAMTFIHPLWSDAPNRANFAKGQALVDEAMHRGRKSDLEDAYIAAVAAYYAQGWDKDETANLRAFEAGWKAVHNRYPEDIEAASFFALAHMATVDPGDKTYLKQKRAGAIAETVLSKIPDHPGGHHYLIHAYDYPPLASNALEAAHRYGRIAPDIPHALHMPTHIFTRVGLWQESIVMNRRSAEAALRHPAGSEISLHYPHALDYLMYAHLQQGDDQNARKVMEELKMPHNVFQKHIAASYSFTAIPARYALERQQWAEAATLETIFPPEYPIDRFPAMDATTYFARALGAARSGQLTLAHQALENLRALHARSQKSSAYWAKQVEIQLLSATAWFKYRENMKDEALMVMQKAAALESTTEKHPVTPGEILPARELLADMLLEMGRYREAQVEYEATLERSANRFNSLYGAGKAAELSHNKRQALLYYDRLVKMTTNATADREQVKHAKLYLKENRLS